MSRLFRFDVDPGTGVIETLAREGDQFETNYALPDEAGSLGDVILRYRHAADQEWLAASTLGSGIRVNSKGSTTTVESDGGGGPLRVVTRYLEVDGYLDWQIDVVNSGDLPVQLGDVALPFAFNTRYARDTETTYTRRVVRHDHVAGHGSFFSFTRPNGVGPFLVLTPANSHTAPEYFQRDFTREASGWEGPFTVWLHSLATGSEIDGDWRMPHTSRSLDPGETVTFAFRFDWAADHEGIRDVVARNGGVDAVVAPGMVVPQDLPARVALRSADPILTIEAEHPDTTTMTSRGDRGDYRLLDVEFRRTGENALVVHQAGGKRTRLEFFSTHPLEELIRSRAAFLARHQQYRGDRWYDGLFGNWDMRTASMTTPDEPHGLPPHCVGGSDDPTICKAPALAEKNRVYPIASEIAAIEYYVEHFLVGKLQRRQDEYPHPMGVYGSDNWYENRNAEGPENFTGGHGRERMWRTFDYTHLIQLYLAMHRIALDNPGLVAYTDADGYLDLAFRTAKAFYTVPYSIFMSGWDFRGYSDWAYKQGNFHEMKIPELIESLEHRGWPERAHEIRRHWGTKVKFMVYDHPYPFGSEMWFDSTAFESTHAVARYGLEHDVPADERGWFDKNAIAPGVGAWRSHPAVSASDFMGFAESQAIANMAARGVIEPAWYRLGSDIRQGGSSNYAMSYMTPLGGAALLDYAVRFADDPATPLRAGFAGQLACFALVHTGADYPWWADPGNAGALAWAFNPSKADRAWIGETIGRGVWPFDGENDSGLSGAMRGARTVLYDDPVLGLVAYGGIVEDSEGGFTVIPRDGVRQRVDIVALGVRLHIEIDRDHIRSVRFTPATPGLELTLDTETPHAHTVAVRVTGSHGADQIVSIAGGTTDAPLQLTPAALARPASRVVDPAGDGLNLVEHELLASTGSWAWEHGWFTPQDEGPFREAVAAEVGSAFTLRCDVFTGRSGDSGPIFRVNEDGGYAVQLSLARQTIMLADRRNDGSLHEVAAVPFDVELNSVYRIAIEAHGSLIRAFVDDLQRPLLTFADARDTPGSVGVRVDSAALVADPVTVPSGAVETMPGFANFQVSVPA